MSAAEELNKLAPLRELKPDLMNAFGALIDVVMAEGALSTKTKELIAIAVSLTTQCKYCLTIHSAAAREAGATDEELAEVTFVAALLRAGGAIMHGAKKVIPKD